MVLYLIQHAEAKSKRDDPLRGLTDSGVRAIGRTATFFGRLNPAVDAIWHSGKKRAAQTADILAEALMAAECVDGHAGLSPEDDIDVILRELQAADYKQLVLIGHLPHLSRLCSLLLVEDQEREPVRFCNAGIVCLERQQTWRLCWMITPDIVS